jgi:hypothetical protein
MNGLFITRDSEKTPQHKAPKVALVRAWLELPELRGGRWMGPIPIVAVIGLATEDLERIAGPGLEKPGSIVFVPFGQPRLLGTFNGNARLRVKAK